MKIWKKNLVAAAVLVAVCAGIYVNWAFGDNAKPASLTDTLDADKLLDTQTELVDNTTTTDYFSAVRLSRQQARDNAVSLLQEAMAYSEDSETSAQNEQLEEIVDTALTEAQIESLVIAKGYTDCVAYIADDGISVAVAAPEGGLQQQDVALIADVVMTQTSYTFSDIRVVEVP